MQIVQNVNYVFNTTILKRWRKAKIYLLLASFLFFEWLENICVHQYFPPLPLEVDGRQGSKWQGAILSTFPAGKKYFQHCLWKNNIFNIAYEKYFQVASEKRYFPPFQQEKKTLLTLPIKNTYNIACASEKRYFPCCQWKIYFQHCLWEKILITLPVKKYVLSCQWKELLSMLPVENILSTLPVGKYIFNIACGKKYL